MDLSAELPAQLSARSKDGYNEDAWFKVGVVGLCACQAASKCHPVPGNNLPPITLVECSKAEAKERRCSESESTASAAVRSCLERGFSRVPVFDYPKSDFNRGACFPPKGTPEFKPALTQKSGAWVALARVKFSSGLHSCTWLHATET